MTARLARLGWTAYGATLGLTAGIAIGAVCARWPDIINNATTKGKR